MPPHGNAATSRKRETWKVVVPAMRVSWARARDGGATRGEKVTLAAVHQLLALYQRLDDRVSLGQIAREEGLWQDAAADCPESIRNAIGKRLKRLHELGAIRYEPARFTGDRARIGLPRGEELGREPNRGDWQSERRANPNDAESQSGETGEPNRKAPRANPGRLASEGFPRDVVPREEPEGARGRSRLRDVRPLAARLTACATANGHDTRREAERVVELVLDHLAVDVVDRALDDLLESGEVPYPGAILTALEPVVDDDHADTIEDLYADPRFRALVRGGTVLAIADACPGPWAEHLEEAELVVEHAARHGIPDDLVRGALEEAALDGLRRPGHVARRLRTTAAELGLELPPLELPPARRITRSK